MHSKCLFIALVLVGIVSCMENVVRFSLDRNVDRKISGHGARPAGLWREKQTKRPVYLSTFQWKNCGAPSNETFLISGLTLTPDPIVVPGTVTANFTGIVNKTMNSPLQVDLELQKDVFGLWIKIPCVDSFGSCTYKDLCSILSSITCPPSFVQQGVPCKCPFNQGSYKLINAGVDIDVYDYVPVGDYRATANLSSNGQFIGCYFIAFTLAN